MILPKININIETQDDREVDSLEKQLSNTEVSGKIFSGMKEYADKSHVLTFWR